MHAVIDWLTREQGGRREPPLGIGEPPYSPEIRLVDKPWPPSEAWSLIVRKLQDLEGANRWLAVVKFRVEEAPHETLREGREFELYEGKRCVARGKVIGEADLANLGASEALARNSR
jgi:hypothetical protein